MSAPDNNNNNEIDDVVTPYTVKAANPGGVNYDKLIEQFGSEPITAELLARFEAVTKQQAHPWLRRGLFFSHRDLNLVLDLFERGEPFYLYTGRGPSSEAMHLGHLIPFMMTKWLQDVFKVPLVIQLTDDEKFFAKRELSLDEANRLAYENAKDIIAVGFDPQRTFLFTDTEYITSGTKSSKGFYRNILLISELVRQKDVEAIFGFQGEQPIGLWGYPPTQAAPSFQTSFFGILPQQWEGKKIHCLIPCAIDQDPFFRMTRDIAEKLHFKKPSVIHSKFFPALQGAGSKMSASASNAASGPQPPSGIFLTDTPDDIAKKIKLYAFSGGRETAAEHRKFGANLAVDVPFQYLNVFEFDDEKVSRIAKAYESGQMLTGEVKQELIKVLTTLVLNHQEQREKATPEVVAKYFQQRKLVSFD